MGPVTDETAPRRGRPPVTSRAAILAAARRVVDAEGWDRLTLRRLAAELGVGTTTLYHHVRDREDLLLQLLDEHVERALGAVELPEDPRERILVALVAIHDALDDWPRAAEVLTVDGFLARVGGPALRMVEAVVGAAVDLGCTPEQAVSLFRASWFYTVGELLVRTRSRERSEAPERRAELFAEAFARPETPHLAAVGPRWPEIAGRDGYRAGLEALVDGTLLRLPAADG
ncbi:TetR/AcrR family transcriptional regulator [Ornithinimicrobium humiphilum]|uniref:TetR family transcriptional regulator n=1 Tax=Ornithinimicrobium humiphilum TaxID=125288 RepID=A0A543KP80_9MICO|nr:TetR family transcriptional regulator [Ornithinimicrobium humiphilum]